MRRTALALILVFAGCARISRAPLAPLPSADKPVPVEQAVGSDEPKEEWDHIGTYQLLDGRKSRKVKLYFYDSDSDAAARKWAKDSGMSPFSFLRIYPNSFSLHALHQTDGGGWVHQELSAGTRTKFLRVERATAHEVVVVCCGFFPFVSPWDEDPLVPWEELHRPCYESISFLDGRLTLT